MARGDQLKLKAMVVAELLSSHRYDDVERKRVMTARREDRFAGSRQRSKQNLGHSRMKGEWSKVGDVGYKVDRQYPGEDEGRESGHLIAFGT